MMNFQEHKSQIATRLWSTLKEILTIKEDLFDKIERQYHNTADQFFSFRYDLNFSEKVSYYFNCTFSSSMITINLLAESSDELNILSTLVLKLDTGCEVQMFIESGSNYANDLAEKICLYNSAR